MPDGSIGMFFFIITKSFYRMLQYGITLYDICIIKFKTLHYGTTDIQIFARSVQF